MLSLHKNFNLHLFFLIVHTIIAYQITKSLDILRILGSVLVLLIMLVAIYCFTLFLDNSSEKVFDSTLIIFLYLLLIISFSGVVFSYVPFAEYRALNSPIFPFVEPSHYSLIVAPFYLWVTVTQKKTFYRLLLIIGGLILLIYISNLTLVIIVLLNCFIAFDIKKFILVILVGIIFASILTFDATYYSKRIDVEDKNLSTLVWLQGWEEAYLDIEKSSGFGIGFQQFGVKDPEGESASAIFYLMKYYLNRYDGGTFASKLMGELGIFGCVILIVISIKICKSILFLKKVRSGMTISTHLVFYHCCVSFFIVELFIRSMAYIAPGFFMFMIGIIGIDFSNIKKELNFIHRPQIS